MWSNPIYNDKGSRGDYWSTILFDSTHALYLFFDYTTTNTLDLLCYFGMLIRPVK